jgi:hypothetical protein
MSPWIKTHRVTIAAVVVLVACALVVSHRTAYTMGRNNTKHEVKEVKDQAAHVNNTVVAAESISNLGVAVRALRVAVKHPDAFPPEDLNYFRHIAESTAADFESRIVPAIKADEEKERKREPSRTVADEERRIEFARKYAREAEELERQLAQR